MFYNYWNQARIGKCHGVPHVLEDGKLELHEEWQWLNGGQETGSSIIAEQWEQDNEYVERKMSLIKPEGKG